MEKKKTNTKLILKGIGAFLIYFLISKFAAIPFYLLGVDLETVPTIIKCLYTIIIQLIVILLIFLLHILNKDLYQALNKRMSNRMTVNRMDSRNHMNSVWFFRLLFLVSILAYETLF